MKKLIILLAALSGGCQSVNGVCTVVGSAYVESDRPEGKAVAKLEVRFTPQGASKDHEAVAKAKKADPFDAMNEAPPVQTKKSAPATPTAEKAAPKTPPRTETPTTRGLLERAAVEQIRHLTTP